MYSFPNCFISGAPEKKRRHIKQPFLFNGDGLWANTILLLSLKENDPTILFTPLSLASSRKTIIP